MNAVSHEEEFQRYPPYVLDAAAREQWDLCHAIAARQVELYADGPDSRYIWFMERWLFYSDVPTGTPADQEAGAAAVAALREKPEAD